MNCQQKISLVLFAGYLMIGVGCSKSPAEPPTPLTGTVQGLIQDERGSVLPQATVSIVDSDHSIRTDSDGRYSFNNLPLPADLSIVARKDGYSSTTTSLALTDDRPSVTVDLMLQKMAAKDPGGSSVDISIVAHAERAAFGPGKSVTWFVDLKNLGPELSTTSIEDSLDNVFGAFQIENVVINRAAFPDAQISIDADGRLLGVELPSVPSTDGFVRAYTFSVPAPPEEGTFCHYSTVTIPISDGSVFTDKSVDCIAATAN